ncbi:myristoylated alanine-rich C-kinase substrate-like [Eleutherodactylus coqui]|uniref:myristoylated alanine-rich C-kinase substrate-like n=1 Tax=Eleutherodactylus coqui TaxID=57060 RepID=UPI0034617D6F
MEAAMEKIRAAVEERGIDWLMRVLDVGAPGPSEVEAAPARSAASGGEASGAPAATAVRERGRRTAAAGSRTPEAAAGALSGTASGRREEAGGSRQTPAASARGPSTRRARAPARLSPDQAPQRRRRIESPSRAPPGRLPAPSMPSGERRPGRNLAGRHGAASGTRSRAARGAGPNTGLSAVNRATAWGRSAGEPVVAEQPHSDFQGQAEVRPVRARPSSRQAAANPEVRMQPEEDPGRQFGPHSDEESDPLEGGSAAGGTTAPTQPDHRAALVWIMGHSFVYWGGERAKIRPNGRQLRLSRETAVIRWIGVRGMAWFRVLQDVQRLVSLDRPPNILVLHVGGNDLGQRPFRDLGRDIRYDMLRMMQMYRGLIVVWSEMVPRKGEKTAELSSRLSVTFVSREHRD